jgi:hypothetical protein
MSLVLVQKIPKSSQLMPFCFGRIGYSCSLKFGLKMDTKFQKNYQLLLDGILASRD